MCRRKRTKERGERCSRRGFQQFVRCAQHISDSCKARPTTLMRTTRSSLVVVEKPPWHTLFHQVLAAYAVLKLKHGQCSCSWAPYIFPSKISVGHTSRVFAVRSAAGSTTLVSSNSWGLIRASVSMTRSH